MMNHNDFPKMTEEFDRSVRRAGFHCCFRMAETRISKGMYRRRTTPS